MHAPVQGWGGGGGSLVLPLHKAPPVAKRGWDFCSSLCRLIGQFVELKCWRTTAGKRVQAWGMTRVHASVVDGRRKVIIQGQSLLWLLGDREPVPSTLTAVVTWTHHPRGPSSGFLDADLIPSTWLSVLAFCLFCN